VQYNPQITINFFDFINNVTIIVKYCHVLVTRTGFGLITGFIEGLKLVITNNYNSLTNLHTLKIITTNNVFFVFISRCLVTASNNIIQEFSCRLRPPTACRLSGFQSIPVNCCWSSPAQPFFFLVPVETHDLFHVR
jgi:hypothetical protein